MTCCDSGLGLAAHTNVIQHGWLGTNTDEHILKMVYHGFLVSFLGRESFQRHSTVKRGRQVRAADPSRGGLSGAQWTPVDPGGAGA